MSGFSSTWRGCAPSASELIRLINSLMLVGDLFYREENLQLLDSAIFPTKLISLRHLQVLHFLSDVAKEYNGDDVFIKRPIEGSSDAFW